MMHWFSNLDLQLQFWIVLLGFVGVMTTLNGIYKLLVMLIKSKRRVTE